ncbi:Tagatose-6-phosphate kinase [Seminavis robusta]|uniref:Tagatose-6-phosphate kinase n=1 Tax=Seminavis robusta TaxID=568900 RepID=A0A9N8EEZ7_9STRA|nr:Tagatose-6-phosphate kinase [Seminavis robusta]|eukprot:Sro841_g209470.1 Tagatose-6-phosphate kinase (393) ;mRNA; r:2934-4112
MSGGGVIVALNGALQKRFVLPSESPLVPGNVHRISEVQVGIGGKGQDVAIALSCLSYSKEKLKIAQFLGLGNEGDLVHEMLEDRVGQEAMTMTVRTESKLRTCTSVVASDTTTELIEPSGAIKADEMKELLSKIEKLEGNSAAAICIMGSMPPGCDDSTYANIYSRCANPNTLCVIDSVAGLEPLIKAIAEKDKQGPTIFKVNASELCKLAGVKKSNNEVDGIQQDELVAAVSGFLKKYEPHAIEALSAIAITDGKHPAHMAIMKGKESFGLYQLPVNALPEGKTLFPIGAGDAVAAGTMAAWQCLLESDAEESCLQTDVKSMLVEFKKNIEAEQSTDVPTMLSSFGFGLACGSASCLQEENSVLDKTDVQSLFQKGKPAFLSSHSLQGVVA